MADSAERSKRNGLLRIAGSGGTVLSGEVISRLVAFVGFPLAALFLSDTELGLLAIALLVLSLMTLLFDFGLTTAATKLHFDYSDGVGGLWWLVFSIEISIAAATIALGPIFTGLVFRGVRFFPLILAVVAAAAGAGLTAFGQARYRATFRAGRLAALTVARAAMLSGPGVAGAAITNTAMGYVWGIAVGQTVLGLATLISFRQEVGRPNTELWRPALRFGLPLVPHLLFGWWLSLADRALLERWRGLAEVGVYALAYQLSFAAATLLVGINNLWAPLVYKWSARNGVGEADKIVAVAVLPILAASTVAAASAATLAPIAFRLIRPGTTAPHLIFVIVALASLFFGFYLLASSPALARGASKVVPVATGIGVVVNLAGNVALIPRHGGVGAAFATLLGLAATATAIAASAPLVGFTRRLTRQLMVGLGGLTALSVAVLAAPRPVDMIVFWLAGLVGVMATTLSLFRRSRSGGQSYN